VSQSAVAALQRSPHYCLEGFVMINGEQVPRKIVPLRTIVAAVAMLAGVILMGLGYFQNEQAWIYLGITITVGGVLVEALFGIIGVKTDMTAGDNERRRS
jgi:hypothetical protein